MKVPPNSQTCVSLAKRWASQLHKSGKGKPSIAFFLEYTQVEASGDVGTLFHLFGGLGLNCWRDMNLQGDITEEALRTVRRLFTITIVLITIGF